MKANYSTATELSELQYLCRDSFDGALGGITFSGILEHTEQTLLDYYSGVSFSDCALPAICPASGHNAVTALAMSADGAGIRLSQIVAKLDRLGSEYVAYLKIDGQGWQSIMPMTAAVNIGKWHVLTGYMARDGLTPTPYSEYLLLPAISATNRFECHYSGSELPRLDPDANGYPLVAAALAWGQSHEW